MKIAILGAGSLVFGPHVLHNALVQHKLEGVELALVDTDEEALFPMADLGRQMAQKADLDVKLTAHTGRVGAIDGAAFVIYAAEQEETQRFEADGRIIEALAPGQAITRCGGVAGISASLRQIRLIQGVCADIKRLGAPGAMLLNLADPLPRVCQAAHEEGVPTVGICADSLSVYPLIWRILHDEDIAFPFEMARSMLDLSMAGLNHLSFVLDLWEHDTGEDLYPRLKDAVAKGRNANQPLTAKLLLELGYFATAGDERIRDFVDVDANAVARHFQPGRLSEKEGERRLNYLRSASQGKKPWELLIDEPFWERPIDLIAALSADKPILFPGLNLMNSGQLKQLPRSVFVETPATVSKSGIVPAPFALPESLLPLLGRAAQITDAIVRAARWRSLDLLQEAIELDPTIPDKAAGRRALDECLKAHAEVLPQYS